MSIKWSTFHNRCEKHRKNNFYIHSKGRCGTWGSPQFSLIYTLIYEYAVNLTVTAIFKTLLKLLGKIVFTEGILFIYVILSLVFIKPCRQFLLIYKALNYFSFCREREWKSGNCKRTRSLFCWHCIVCGVIWNLFIREYRKHFAKQSHQSSGAVNIILLVLPRPVKYTKRNLQKKNIKCAILWRWWKSSVAFVWNPLRNFSAGWVSLALSFWLSFP